MDFDIAIERLQERIVLRLKTKTKANSNQYALAA
jgi:hypothetical protein